jgi:hypothetical protein
MVGRLLTLREKTMREVLMVLAMVVAWYANISDRPGAVMCPGDEVLDGDTIQSMGSDSSLPYLLVPYAHPLPSTLSGFSALRTAASKCIRGSLRKRREEDKGVLGRGAR